MSNELPRVHQALGRAGVTVRTLQTVAGFDGAELTLADLFPDARSRLACATLVIVGMRADHATSSCTSCAPHRGRWRWRGSSPSMR